MAGKSITEYLAEIGRKGGQASGKARMKKLTPEQRSKIARDAVKKRWDDYYKLHPEKRATARPAESRASGTRPRKSAA